MDIIELAQISLEGPAPILLIVIAIKFRSSCLGNALQLE